MKLWKHIVHAAGVVLQIVNGVNVLNFPPKVQGAIAAATAVAQYVVHLADKTPSAP